jgi:CRP/FNR family transcriptional regulator, cyclic AMP receptor protein
MRHEHFCMGLTEFRRISSTREWDIEGAFRMEAPVFIGDPTYNRHRQWTSTTGLLATGLRVTISEPGSQHTSLPPRPSPAAMLSAHPFFKDIDPKALDRLARYMRIARAPKGSILFRKGDAGTFLVVVLDGAIKISAPTSDGREVLFNVVRTGETLGEIAVLDGAPRTADAIALTDSSLALLDRRDIVGFLTKNPDVALQFIAVLCRTLRHVSDHLEGVMFQDLATRLARALALLCGKQGGALQLTQLELSQAIGSSREGVNQQLRLWQDRGIVRLEKNLIVILDMPALVKLSGRD